ncbi:MAG TPA: DUF262 domain-containing protein [Bacilli bacterium]|nr:DUF262 domain-containing protein [Bacilli bacterium]
MNNINIDKEILDEIEANEDLDDFELKRFTLNSYKIERSIRDIMDWIKREKIVVPKFQRKSVWTFNQSAKFIESILLGLPTPDLFMFRKVDKGEEKFLLIDGFQRITTIRQFIQGVFIKSNNEEKKFSIPFKNSNWSGKAYGNLDEEDINYINDYSLKISVFDSIQQKDQATENNIMTSIFERINTGSTTLTSQEIRHAVYFGQAVIKLEELATNEYYLKNILEDKQKDSSRRNNEELYLRLLTYYFVFKRLSEGVSSFDGDNKIKFYSSKKIMLDNFLNYINLNKLNGLELLQNLSNDINNTMKEISEKCSDAFYAYSLLRDQLYPKVYEPFAEALTLVILKKSVPLCSRENLLKIKKHIWIDFDQTKDTIKKYSEFFENTTSLDNIIKRVQTLETLLTKMS